MAHGMAAEGTRRLRLVLGLLGVAGCLAGFVVVLGVYGRPFWPGWWAVMAVILALSFIVPRTLVPIVEWVIAGYKN